jgi:hypothetical protein
LVLVFVLAFVLTAMVLWGGDVIRYLWYGGAPYTIVKDRG